MTELRNRVSMAEAIRLAIAAGFPVHQAVIAGAVAMAESRLDPSAHNTRPPDDSVGLWQINMNAHGTRFGSVNDLKNPAINARAAYTIWKERGESWSAWGAYTGPDGSGSDGPWLDHREAAAAAATTDPELRLARSNDDDTPAWDPRGWLDDVRDWQSWFGADEDEIAGGQEVVNDVLGLDELWEQALRVATSVVFSTAALVLITLGLFRLTGTDPKKIYGAASVATGGAGALKAVL